MRRPVRVGGACRGGLCCHKVLLRPVPLSLPPILHRHLFAARVFSKAQQNLQFAAESPVSKVTAEAPKRFVTEYVVRLCVCFGRPVVRSCSYALRLAMEREDSCDLE